MRYIKFRSLFLLTTLSTFAISAALAAQAPSFAPRQGLAAAGVNVNNTGEALGSENLTSKSGLWNSDRLPAGIMQVSGLAYKPFKSTNSKIFVQSGTDRFELVDSASHETHMVSISKMILFTLSNKVNGVLHWCATSSSSNICTDVPLVGVYDSASKEYRVSEAGYRNWNMTFAVE